MNPRYKIHTTTKLLSRRQTGGDEEGKLGALSVRNSTMSNFARHGTTVKKDLNRIKEVLTIA